MPPKKSAHRPSPEIQKKRGLFQMFKIISEHTTLLIALKTLTLSSFEIQLSSDGLPFSTELNQTPFFSAET